MIKYLIPIFIIICIGIFIGMIINEYNLAIINYKNYSNSGTILQMNWNTKIEEEFNNYYFQNIGNIKLFQGDSSTKDFSNTNIEESINSIMPIIKDDKTTYLISTWSHIENSYDLINFKNILFNYSNYLINNWYLEKGKDSIYNICYIANDLSWKTKDYQWQLLFRDYVIKCKEGISFAISNWIKISSQIYIKIRNMENQCKTDQYLKDMILNIEEKKLFNMYNKANNPKNISDIYIKYILFPNQMKKVQDIYNADEIQKFITNYIWSNHYILFENYFEKVWDPIQEIYSKFITNRQYFDNIILN